MVPKDNVGFRREAWANPSRFAALRARRPLLITLLYRLEYVDVQQGFHWHSQHLGMNEYSSSAHFTRGASHARLSRVDHLGELISRLGNSTCMLQLTLEDQCCRFLVLGHRSVAKHQTMLVKMNYAY